jgi:Sec-independent protein translocase protein TatA
MKKTMGFIAVFFVIILLVFFYLRIGEKSCTEAVSGMKGSQGQINDAKQAVDAMNASTEETKKAIENATGAGTK